MCGPLAPIQLFVDGSVERIAHHPVRERERSALLQGRGVVRTGQPCTVY